MRFENRLFFQSILIPNNDQTPGSSFLQNPLPTTPPRTLNIANNTVDVAMNFGLPEMQQVYFVSSNQRLTADFLAGLASPLTFQLIIIMDKRNKQHPHPSHQAAIPTLSLHSFEGPRVIDLIVVIRCRITDSWGSKQTPNFLPSRLTSIASLIGES